METNDVINYIENNLKIRIKESYNRIFSTSKTITVQLYLTGNENEPEKIISEDSIRINNMFG